MAPTAAAFNAEHASITSPISSNHVKSSLGSPHEYHKHLSVTIASDTDSASENGSYDESMVTTTTSVPSVSWKGFHAVEHEEQFTSGADAILHVAGNMSDNVFLYPLLQASIDPSTTSRARIVTLDIQQGAATAVRGALAVGMRAAAVIPSQTLPLFLPSLFQIAQQHQPAVFHVSCESLRSDLAVRSSYEVLYALQHSGAILLNSSFPQECHDMAVIAHVTAHRLQRLVVHFYDGSRVAREQTTLRLLTPSALTTVASVEAFSFSPTTSNTAEQVQQVMQVLFPVLEHPYHLYEYYGATDATNVIVVMGEATTAIQQAVAYEQMLGHPVGVVQVRVLLPWSHKLFAMALPSSAQRVAVLENMSIGAFAMQQGLLTQNVQVFFHSDQWTGGSNPVLVRTGLYGGGFTHGGFTIGMGRAVFHHLEETTTRRSFLIVPSEALEEATVERGQLDVIYGEGLKVEGDQGFTKQLLWWGYEMGTTGATVELLQRNPSTHIHAIVNHSVPTATSPSVVTIEVQLSKAGTRVIQRIQEADVSIVSNLELLSSVNVLASVKENGVLLVNATWKTMDEVEDVMSRLWVKELAAKRIQLWVIDLNDVQQRVTVDSIAKVAASVAFFKAAGLYNERVIYALLANQFPVEEQTTLRSFVSSVWGETLQLLYRPYPPESVSSEVLNPTLSGATLASLAISKVPHSSTKPMTKRTRPDVSKETSLAWKLLFPDHYQTRQSVRDHVTDVIRVTKWERLTPESYERNVFHMEMDIFNTSIQYSIGEALAVFAHNDDKDVHTLLQLYGVEADAVITIPCVSHHKCKGSVEPAMEETLTYYQLFAQVLDLCGRPSKKFYEALASIASDEKEKKILMHLLDVEGKEEYKQRVEETTTFLDLLLEFPGARPTMEQLITLIPRIKPRHYSIASSMKKNPTSVHLLIVVHDWTTPNGTYRIGQATRFLRTVRPGQLLSVSVCSSVMKLPVNHQDPIIMAGLGTGMAPFRAFIQERAYLKAKGIAVGPIALYFGSRNRANEFLYGEELEQYEQEGLLTYLRCAFSRDQPHKVYIQDKIAQDKEILADWLIHKNAHFYLCGPTWPVADVREALITALTSTSVGTMDRKQANGYIELMREQGRYVLEVY